MVDDSYEHKKGKKVNKNVVARISHSEYKDALLNNECLMHEIKRVQSKSHKIGAYIINKVSLLSFVNKICILSNGYDGLALDY